MATDPHHRPRPTTPRIPIVENPSEEVLETDAKGIASPDGNPINIFATLAHHPKVLKRFTNYAGFFLNKGLLPAREREIVILRVGWNCRSVYEFGQPDPATDQRVLTELIPRPAIPTDPQDHDLALTRRKQPLV
ncbi:MAG: hypothetical protein ACKOQ1_07895, partial [Actinomycetota bacterium]